MCACEVFVLFKLHAFVSISVFSHPNLRRGGEGEGQWMNYCRCDFSCEGKISVYLLSVKGLGLGLNVNCVFFLLICWTVVCIEAE